MARYRISEDSGASEIIEAESLEAALERAEEWSADGYYDERTMVHCYAQAIDEDGERIGDCAGSEIEVGPEPEAPDCTEDQEHDWQSPEWLGGCRENPGVWSHGGTAISTTEVCAHCGAYRCTYRAGSQRNPGELAERVTYQDADARSLAWIADRA